MSIFYSPSKRGFYNSEIHAVIPEDKIEISPERHAELMAEQASGKIIVPNESGFPIAQDPIPQPITWDDIRSKRNRLLADSDWTQLADVSLSPAKKAEFIVYREFLRNVTHTYSNPESVIWPEIPVA